MSVAHMSLAVQVCEHSADVADQPHCAGQHHRVHCFLADYCAGPAEALLPGVQQAEGGV